MRREATGAGREWDGSASGPAPAASRGFVCEKYGAKFTLPNRDPIGANCLANARDSKTPIAALEDREGAGSSALQIRLAALRAGRCGAVRPPRSVDFRGPRRTSETAGTANVDFVIFPKRWSAAEHSFRPPSCHMNIMSGFMGLMYGIYDAKPEGFTPGGMSPPNCMLPHGPDRDAYEQATKLELKAVRISNTLAFMFETRFPQHLTSFAAELTTLQEDYAECWARLEKRFTGGK